MLSFDPQDPFPLLPAGSHTYAEAQAHSALVDEWLGLEVEKTETGLRSSGANLRAHHQAWIGLPAHAMQTPYTELRSLLAELSPRAGQRIVDLGAGYGRMAFVIGAHHPEVEFLGYELVAERVVQGRRALARRGLSQDCLVQADLTELAELPPAEFFFLYDFGTREAIEKSLQDMRTIASHRPITVIGRGRASRDAIERRHPWLSQVHPPRHFPHYSIYRS